MFSQTCTQSLPVTRDTKQLCATGNARIREVGGKRLEETVSFHSPRQGRRFTCLLRQKAPELRDDTVQNISIHLVQVKVLSNYMTLTHPLPKKVCRRVGKRSSAKRRFRDIGLLRICICRTGEEEK